jgi:hypothetical protein
MTQEEATDLSASLNQTIKNAGADEVVLYDVFAYWDQIYTKYYNVCLYPKMYQAQYKNASDSQKIAFARVSLKAQMNQPSSYDDFVVAFNAQKDLDQELSNYLKS